MTTDATPLHPIETWPTTLIEALDRHVAVRGDKVFTRHLLSGEAYELTFAQFAGRAEHYAAAFQSMGVTHGEVVLIFLPTSIETLPAFFGAMMIGAIPSLMPCPSAKQHPSIYWPSHDTLLERIKPRAILTNRENAAQMILHGLSGPGRQIVAIEDLGTPPKPAVRHHAAPEEVALLQHSSGTTSLKKGVALSHVAILRQVRHYANRLQATHADGMTSWLPIYHDMGLIACSVVPLVLGQTVTILDPFQWVGRPATLFDAIDRYDGKFVWLPNFSFEHLCRTVPQSWSGDLSRMRAFVDCSEPCKTETVERFIARFEKNGVRRDQIHASYGMAETVFAITQTPPGTEVGSVTVDLDTLQQQKKAVDVQPGGKPIHFFSNGRPIDGINVTLRDGDRILGENEVGEVVVSGEYLFDGYFNNPELTAEKLVDGWYSTRDRAFFRDGEMYVLGRKDDMIIVSGRNLHANEVELIVNGVAGLKPGRGVAFGVYNDTNASEELVIVAERDDAVTVPDDVIEAKVRELVYDHTNIDVRDVKVVAPGWLVKTTSGKISREMNRVRYLEMRDAPEEPAAPAAAAPAAEAQPAAIDPAESSLDDIARIIARVFRCPKNKVSRQTVATDIAGWDSLAHSTLILEVEQELGIRFADNEIFGFENVGALVDRADALRAEGSDGGDRILAQDENFSIIVLGEPNDEAPDLIIFAGAALQFGGQNMMDFASTLRGTPAEKSRRFFITDRAKHWFTDSIDKIATALNEASPGPKIVMGNSMGGYGALKFAPLLRNVQAVLSFAPQPAPAKKVAREMGREGEEWYVQPTPGVPTCIIYGEIEDERGKEWCRSVFTDEALNRVLILNNCGHNVVPYLNGRGLLKDVLTSALEPETMIDKVSTIVGSVEPSEEELLNRVHGLGFMKMGAALTYMKTRYPKPDKQAAE